MGCGALFVVVVAVGSVALESVAVGWSPLVWVSAAGRSGLIRRSARRRIGLHRECVEVDVGGGWGVPLFGGGRLVGGVGVSWWWW